MRGPVSLTIFFLLCGRALPCAAQGGTATEALNLFNQYKPNIEASNNALIDEPQAFTGDLNGDGRTDAIVFFVITPAGGRNMIIGRDTAVYLAGPNGLKVTGAFPSQTNAGRQTQSVAVLFTHPQASAHRRIVQRLGRCDSGGMESASW